ncbi:hypothetical protein [Nannocystis sp. SCPEA4]|uniref:hypothetical protein n=1 Tax=Nannocystis sp. SCPEA4 TaxID=2996787 RepID=UPI00226FF15F|nr:hypothetical protein [Nannocystis sp. SCPEA4]MCY1056531.1 hypothetical protein [Nannocystis sp. SCPEA4]
MTSRFLTVVLSLGCGCNSLYLLNGGEAGTSTGMGTSTGIDSSTGADVTTTMGPTEATMGDATTWMVVSISTNGESSTSAGETSTVETSTSTGDASSGDGPETTGGDKKPRLVFLTSDKLNGTIELEDEEAGNEISGLKRADWHCQKLAMIAGHDGVFMAWLSKKSSTADSRLGADDEINKHPLALVEGEVVAANWDELTKGWSNMDKRLDSPIIQNEYGDEVPANDSTFWSWTNRDGSWSGHSCPDLPIENQQYHGHVGKGSRTDHKWSTFELADCASSHRLLCIQTSFENPPADP